MGPLRQRGARHRIRNGGHRHLGGHPVLLPAEPGHRLGTAIVVSLLGQGVGAFNEVVEFWSTHLLAATNVGGYENTGRDLVANLLGSAVAG